MQLSGRVLTAALCAIASAAPAFAQAQQSGRDRSRSAPEVVYDWSTGGKQAPTLYAGGRVRFRVQNVNPLCYSAAIDAQAVDAEVNVTDLLSIVRGPQTQSQSPAPPTPAPVRAAPPGRAPAPPLRALSPAEERILLDRAEAWLINARSHLQAAESERAEAAFLVEAVTRPSCQAGRAFNFGNIVHRWQGLKRASAPGRPLASGLAQLRDGYDALTDASGALQRVSADGGLAARHRNLIARHDTLNGQVLQLAALLPALQGAVESAGVRLDELSRQSQQALDDLTLDHDTERVKVTIRSLVIQGSGAPALEDIVDEIPVRRRHRAFLSTGVLVTGVEQPHYAQVHRQAADAEGKPLADSTFLTYASTERGDFAAFSPAVQLNVSFVHEPASFLVSFGATARTVNESLGVEPFAGVSGSLLDRFVVTVGHHWGRREELLLGDEDEVESRPIPSDITRNEAVGTRWASGWFVSFSVKP